MERRDFVGAALALFTGVAMPEPIRELVWVQDPWMPPDNLLISEEVMENVLKRVFCEPLMSSLVVPQSELNAIFSKTMDALGTPAGRYIEVAHYFGVE